MRIQTSIVNDSMSQKMAQQELAKGGEVILPAPGPHDQKLIKESLSSPDFQKSVAAGAALGGLGGVALGTVIKGVTQTHPLVGSFAMFFLGVLGAVIGGAAGPDAFPVAQTAKAKRDVEVVYDAEAGHFVARLKPQPAK